MITMVLFCDYQFDQFLIEYHMIDFDVYLKKEPSLFSNFKRDGFFEDVARIALPKVQNDLNRPRFQY